MSFITKRERVFNDYDQFELPARNEGKLKTYSSCTDTRAWSHFYSDKSEHLVDIIKRNNQTCRAKYVPTDVIVNTLMAAKNAEISRLKRRIEEYEQIVAAYDQLELTCEQKCEIASAHAAIKQANKELDDLFINLDMSNYTEGLDSERYETVSSGGPGKGDEWQNFRRDEENQCSPVQSIFRCYQDSSTNAVDPRIDELQDALIRKDAKLNALQNVKAILENEICEPYCIYAHIYTALEKIFAILSQNGKYKIYLGLMESRKNTRDIKGKILHKLNVLEQFNSSLLSQTFYEFDLPERVLPVISENSVYYCSESFQHMETMSEITPTESKIDKKRAQLVADIMDEEEIEELLGKENPKRIDSMNELDIIGDYNVENENLKRLKALQLSYDELLACHESVKHDRDNLQLKCNRYDDLEQECIDLRNQLREYNDLWNEKEHYRRRSEELHNLKEQYLILAEETSNIETQLKAETEISQMRFNTIEELRQNNMNLEKKLNDATLAFNKEKSSLLCKLKEMECQIMCQEQQIKSLSSQIDMLIEQERNNVQHEEDSTKTLVLIEEIKTLKNQINEFKSVLFYSDEEKLQLEEQMKTEIEKWKCSYEKIIERNTCLERQSEDYRKQMQDYRKQMQDLVDENTKYKHDLEEKSETIHKLMAIIADKSQNIGNMINEITAKKKENLDLVKQMEYMQKTYKENINELQNEKLKIIETLKMKTCESNQTSINDFQENSNLDENVEYNKLKEDILAKDVEIEELDNELKLRTTQNEVLCKEILLLKQRNECTEKEIEKLKEENNKIEEQLQHGRSELESAFQILELTKVKNDELLSKMQQTECLKLENFKLKETYNKSLSEKLAVQKELVQIKRVLNEKILELSNVKEMLAKAKTLDEVLENTSHRLIALEKEVQQLNISYKNLQEEKANLQQENEKINEDVIHLQRVIDRKTKENIDLTQQIKSNKETMAALESELVNNKAYMNSVSQQTKDLTEKLKDYESLALEFKKLNEDHCKVNYEKEELQKELNKHLEDLKCLEQEKANLETFKNTFKLKESFAAAQLQSQLQLSVNQTKCFPYTKILQEIDSMKSEKEENQNKIHNLLEKLEKSEQIITNLNEDLLTRDDKIAILENHTNALEDEVRKLHNSLETMLNAGEQMKDSYKKITESLEKVEREHKNAINNMKQEIKCLQDENVRLENQLSVANIKADESYKDVNKYASQAVHLQHEKDIVIDNIKQLDYEVTGESALSHDNCNIEIVIQTLDKLRRHFNLKNLKNSTLEQTIHKVQTTSQLLISKAEEAKKIVEKEKQKITAEKEEAIAARIDMETQLNDFRKQLKEQSINSSIIRDLELEIMKQKIIIDKINKSKMTYITKLEEETNNMQNLYQNALAKIGELDVEKQEYLIDKAKYIDVINNLNQDLEMKKGEVTKLHKYINNLKSSISIHDVAIQTYDITKISSNMCSQTERYKNPRDIKNTEVQTDSQQICSQSDIFVKDEKEDDQVNINVMKINHPPKEKIQPVKDLLSKKKHPTNEVQILAITVEPAFDFVKNSYLNYKLNRLSLGHLEQYSITCVAHASDSEKISNPLLEQDFLDNTPFILDVHDNHSGQLKVSSVNINPHSLPLSRCTNYLLENNQKITAESVGEEDLFTIYQDRVRLQTNKNPNNVIGVIDTSQQQKENVLQVESKCQYHKNSDDVLVSSSLIASSTSADRLHSDLETSSLQSKELKQENVSRSDVISTDKPKINFKQNNLKPSLHLLTKNEADYILIENNNEIEKDYSTTCNNVTESLKLVNQRKNIISFQKCKSLSFISSTCSDQAVLVKIDATHEFEKKIQTLTTALENIEKDYKRKLEAFKAQYDASIKKIINEHNQGVQCIQNLHEDTLKEMTKKHENEIETLRAMSLEAMRKAEKLQQENLALKSKLDDNKGYIDEEPVKISSRKAWRRRDLSVLTTTKVESFNVKPKAKMRPPCACCTASNFSDSAGGSSMKFDNFEKIKLAERTLLNDIAHKIMSGSNIESLDKQELLYLHSKVCRHWKKKLEKNESPDLKMDDLKTELTCKQQNTLEHIAELNRKEAEERRILQEARDSIKLRTASRESDSYLSDNPAGTMQSEIHGEEFRTSLDLENESSNSRPVTANTQRAKRTKDSKNTIENGEAPTRLRRPVKSPTTSKSGKKWGDKK